MSKTIQLDADSIHKALTEQRPTSLTKLWQALGGKGSVGGATAKKLREIVPGLAETLKANKGDGSLTTQRAAKPKASKVPRHPQNPFRDGSNYGSLVDLIAAAGKDGIAKDALIKSYCRAVGKPERLAKYDLSVIVSASQDAERRHRSCRDGFQILRTGDNLSVTFG